MRSPGPASILLVGLLVVGVAACGASSSSSGAKSSAAPIRAASAGAASTGGASSGAATTEPAAQALGQAASAGATASVGATGEVGATVAPATADIVENGRLDVQLRSPAALRAAFRTIEGLAGSAGGFVSASTLTNATVPSASMTLRIPDADLATVTDRIAALGRVTTQTLSGQDVTGQVVDVAVEIANLTSEEAAVRHLLADAGSVHDILTVQQQLFALQDDIQELTAQSDSLHDQVRYATVAVALATVPVPVRPHTPPSTLDRFGHLAGAHTVGLVRDVFLAVGWSAPGLVLVLLAGGAGALVVRHRRPRPAPAPATGSGERA